MTDIFVTRSNCREREQMPREKQWRRFCISQQRSLTFFCFTLRSLGTAECKCFSLTNVWLVREASFPLHMVIFFFLFPFHINSQLSS